MERKRERQLVLDASYFMYVIVVVVGAHIDWEEGTDFTVYSKASTSTT